jgi:ubiquitin-conjugating enzyme E2 S
MAPAVIMSVAKELRKLSQEPLDGIKVQLNEDDVTDITADVTGPGACAHPPRPGARSR